jgi:hypothetical protein
VVVSSAAVVVAGTPLAAYLWRHSLIAPSTLRHIAIGNFPNIASSSFFEIVGRLVATSQRSSFWHFPIRSPRLRVLSHSH